MIRALTLVALLASGCAVPRDAGFPEVRERVGDRTGYPPVWSEGSASDRLIDDTLHELLAAPLTLDRAVEISLLANPELQSRYAALGVAQADLVQAGLVANPKVGVSVRIPTMRGLQPIVEGGLGWNFASLLTMAARKRVAADRFEAVKLEIAAMVVSHIAEVKKAFISVEIATAIDSGAKAIAELAQGSFDTAAAMHKSGGLGDLELARRQAEYEGARLDWVDARAETVHARERLNRLLGLWGAAIDWRIDGTLRGLPAEDVSLDGIETVAVEGRFDLAAAKQRTLSFARALQAAGDWAWLGDLDLGADFKHGVNGHLYVGPAGSIALPIFDQGQATVARLRAELRRSYFEVTRLALAIRSEARELRSELVTHRRRAQHYRDVIVPLRERIVALAQEQYNFMLIGAFELFDEKRRELEARRESTRELGAYWITRAELERAVGGKL